MGVARAVLTPDQMKAVFAKLPEEPEELNIHPNAMHLASYLQWPEFQPTPGSVQMAFQSLDLDL